MANYREPQWLLPNEKNLAMPASDATVGSGLAEDRHSLYSMKFDGTEYIDINPGSSSTIDLTSFTISAWVKWTNSGNSYGTAIRLSTTGDDIWIYLGRSTGFNFGVRFFLGSTALDDTDFLPTNEWKHIVVRYDESATSMKIYVDGQEKISTTANKNPSLWNTTSINQIGANGSGGEEMQGSISQVSIFDYALSTTEIAALSVANAPANVMALSSKPAAYYPLGEQARRGSEWQFPNEVLQSQVFDFDGTDYISLDKSLTDLNISTSFSISCWVNITSNTNYYHIVGAPTSYAAWDTGFGLYTNGSGIRFWVEQWNGANQYVETAALNTGQWYHVLATFNTTNGLKLYINGGTPTTATGTTIDGLSNDIFIGSTGTNTTYGFNGKLSNTAIWNSDQSANIANIYNNGSPQSSYTTTPTAWYKLNATSNYAGLNPNFHNALSFDGSNDDISITQSNLGTSNTISLWYKSNGKTPSYFTLLGDSTAPNEYAIWVQSGSTIWYKVQDPLNGSINWSVSNVDDGKWHNFVFSRTNTTVNFYIDGNLQTVNSNTLANNDTKIDSIGSKPTLGDFFKGELSNVAFFNQATSAEDVLYLYNGGTPQTSLSFEPLSWWKLDNLTTGIQDSGSASNNGTNNGATEVTDSVAVDQWNFDNAVQSQTPNWSSALDFDGTNDYINIPYNANITPQTGNFTISAWINSDNLSGWHPIWSPLVLDSAVAAVALHTFDTNIRVTIGRPTSGWALLLDSTATLSTDTWYHIAVTFDFSGNAQIYINGQADNSAAIGTHSTSWSTADRAIGEGEGFWSGSISNLALFNTALDASAISTLYNNGQPETAISSSPVSWWKLDNITTGIQDSGSASNNGTNNGATEIQTNVWTPRLNGESTTLPSTALVSSDLQFESPYSNFSLDFDGANDYVETGFTPPIGASARTISVWFYPDNSSFKNICGYGSAISNQGFDIVNYTSNTVGVHLFGTAVLASGTYNASAWNHYAVTYDGTTLRGYLNGVAVGTSTNTVNTGTTLNFEIARGAYTTANYFNGKIDEVAIWSSALTQAQISQVYNNGYPADLTSLSPVSWWRLGENAYFVSPNFTVPNQITGAPNGTSANMDQSDLVADAPGSYASGIGSSLALADRVGDAPESTANSLSFNMTPLNKISYPAGYAPTQADNVYSMAFDGVNDYVNLGSPSELNLTGEMSAFAWIKTNSLSGTDGVVMDLSSGGTQAQWGLEINRTAAKVSVLGNGSGAVLTGGTSLTTGTWFHIGFTRSGTASNWTYTIYVNGVSDGTVTTATNPDAQQGSAIGRLGSYNGGYFNGEIDEVAIFNYPLSARQIKQDIYNGTTTGKTADLNNISNLTPPVAWYRMGD